jgi:hypothetical protein
MTVDSGEGIGTVVSVFLPSPADLVVQASATKLSQSTALIGGVETIFVCNDEGLVLSAEKVLLESVGYSVIATGSPGRCRIGHSGNLSVVDGRDDVGNGRYGTRPKNSSAIFRHENALFIRFFCRPYQRV